MECEPTTLRPEVAQVAWPELKVCEPQSVIFVPPSLNASVPVGEPEPGATTLSTPVKVTDWPDSEGFVEELNAIEVAALFTVWLKLLEVLVLKLVSPP